MLSVASGRKDHLARGHDIEISVSGVVRRLLVTSIRVLRKPFFYPTLFRMLPFGMMKVKYQM